MSAVVIRAGGSPRGWLPDLLRAFCAPSPVALDVLFESGSRLCCRKAGLSTWAGAAHVRTRTIGGSGSDRTQKPEG